jgi:hypothetical protein
MLLMKTVFSKLKGNIQFEAQTQMLWSEVGRCLQVAAA